MSELTTRKYFDNIYIPAGLIVFGCFITKREWTPYAVALALALAAYKFNAMREFGPSRNTSELPTDEPPHAEIKKVLKPDTFQDFELKEKTIISHNVAIEKAILGLPIGQHISIGANCPQPDGTTKEIVRSYTPISGDHQPGYFDLLIKSYPTGNISKYMASMKVGQTLKVRGPKGAFVYTPNMVRHFGMIAGGTGITPMLQIVRAVIRGRPTGDKTEIDLIFANVTPQDILLKEDLDALAKEDAGFRVHYVLDKPPAGWTGGVGYVTGDMITKLLPKAADDVKLLLCGPPPMVSGLKKTAETLGFKKARPVSKLEDQIFAF
ncbi:NADH-cytochrome b5 reductase 1 [Colletotrichum cuscutae]|uniref:NADH-cytochrome b5 reductase n=1 Tax=Colletotrichum cuscutae TaxID=1209917 RepID=A0AAI9UGM1_9PEZI|nr:NADH-cytochrome b5 reductase 1 [Colletotrichum cuscutae]